MTIVMKVFLVTTFLILLAPTALQDVDPATPKSAYVGEKVELSCRRKATSNANEIVWFKNYEILYQLGFKEDERFDVTITKSFAKLVIPSVEENDTGLYQCGAQMTNLTVLPKNSQNSSTESSVDVNTLLCSLNMSLLIGTIIFHLFMWKWLKGKFKQCRPIAGLEECATPLTNDDFKKMVDVFSTALCRQQQTLDDFVIRMKHCTGSMEDAFAAELITMKESRTEQLEHLVVPGIGKLEEEVSSNHNFIVNELKQQGNIIKRQGEAINSVQLVQEILLKNLPSDKRGIPVTDDGLSSNDK